MTVYVVTGTFFYEGETVLGVFKTLASAKAFVKGHKEGRAHGYDEYNIDEKALLP